MNGEQPKMWQGEGLPTTGCAVIEIFGQRTWIYSGSRIVATPDGLMLMPPSQWQVGRPRHPTEYFADGRQPRTHDTMPSSR